MNKKQQQLLQATKKELRKQVFLVVVIYLLSAIGLLVVNPTLFWVLLALLTVPGVVFLFRARRGVTFCAWRAFGLIFDLLFIGLLVIYIIANKTGLGSWETLAVSFSIALAGALIIHFARTIPYWRDTYALNLARKKIDLARGLFSVTTRWAIRGSLSTAKAAWLPLVVVAGPTLAAMLRGSGNVEAYVMLGVATLVIWGGLYAGLIELHYAYKLRQIEKQIGKPLIIDAFAHEYNR